MLYLKGDAMWMADLKHGEHVGELPAYAPAFKEVFILEALGGDDVVAIRLFRYLAGEMPEELLGIARSRERAEQSNRERDRPSRVQGASIGRMTRLGLAGWVRRCVMDFFPSRHLARDTLDDLLISILVAVVAVMAAGLLDWVWDAL